jgi:chemotaxis protein MotA
MFGIIGILVIFGMVFGSYILGEGDMAIILHAAPHELMAILGAAVGAFLIANNIALVKQTMKDMGKVFKGAKWKQADYQDLLCLLFTLIRISRDSPVDLETHIEDPDSSAVFGKYPKIQSDKTAVALIADTLRSASMNYDDPHQVEEVLEKRMEEHYHHAKGSAHALQVMADGLPALGIVAAVLGVIKTMGSIDKPPAVLGGMIGGALVGTFLGVFIAYGLVAPFAGKVESVVDEDNHFYNLIREVLVANLYNHAPNICVEVGRQNTPGSKRPSFNDLEAALKEAKAAA